jgi:5-methylcytosine-specific restriction enzyme subunit McrC
MRPDPPRTVLLTERVPRVCTLAPADVDFLLAHHRARLDLTPTERRHRYRLTPAGVVGVLVAPTRRLVIRPKVPLRNLFLMLDPLAPAPAEADAVDPVRGTEALDFLAGQVALRLAEHARAGLPRAYAERADEGPYLLGALDLPAQLREAPARKDRLHCRHDDFTADVPLNQVPAAVARALLASPLPGEPVRAALRSVLPAFDGVRPVPLTPDLLARVAPERVPPEHAPLLDLCRLLADSLVPGAEAGAVPAPAFLLDLESVFERHVTRGVADAFAGVPGVLVAPQRSVNVNSPAPGQPDVTMRPDVTVDSGGAPALVVDAKWKRLRPDALHTDDLYQVLAYCTALGARRGVLVYPGTRDRAWDYDFPHTPVRLTVRTLNVAGPRDSCARSLRRLGRDLRRLP